MPGLVADPLFQLNLLLWCTLPSSPDGVERIFRAEGYEIQSIAPRLRPRVGQLADVRALGGQDSASPELVLYASGKKHMMTLECKAVSFSSASSLNVAQLVVFMIVEGPGLRDALGIHHSANISSSVGYVIPTETTRRMADTLEDAYLRIRNRGHPCNTGFVMLLDERPDGVYMGIERSDGLNDPSLRVKLEGWPRVLAWTDGSAWRPLYVLPVDPSIDGIESDVVGKEILEERIRAPLLARVGNKIGTAEFEISVDDLMRSAVPVWNLWGAIEAKKAVRTFGLGLVRLVATELRAAEIAVAERGGRFVVDGTTPEKAARVRRGLRLSLARRLPLDLTTPEQGELFDE